MKHLDDKFIGDQEFLRQINLSTVLTHLRENAPLSRAALVEIRCLVQELIEHGFVREGGFQSLRAGRPSILLQLDPEWLEHEFNTPIYVDNQANMVALTESSFGSARDSAQPAHPDGANLNDASLMGSVATVYSQILSNPNQAFGAKRGLLQSQEVTHK
jgi:hypothetical protein